jgi:hypothetical protein
MEEFSLIVLCKDGRHLLPLTLDTLKPQKGAFEVLLLDGEGKGHLQELAAKYPELSIRVEQTGGGNLAEMMNRGVELSRGKYLQFLEPGDRYLSHHGLAFLSELIQKHGEPHLIYANAAVQGIITPVDLPMAHSPWFLRTKILSAGGFNPLYSQRPVLDLLCRLFEEQKSKAIFCPRVLIDSESRPFLSKEKAGFETCKILYRHYGFWRALKWLVFQNQLPTFSRAATFFKQAFWKES